MIEKNVDKVIVGAALALAASTLLPIAKNTFGPLAVQGSQGAASLIDRAKTAIQIAREEIEDIIAEAQFERMKKELDKEIALLDSDTPRL